MLNTIRGKVIITALLLLIGLTVVDVYDMSNVSEDMLMNAKRREAKELTESACSVIKKFYNLYEAGKLSEREAQRKALEVIAAMR